MMSIQVSDVAENKHDKNFHFSKSMNYGDGLITSDLQYIDDVVDKLDDRSKHNDSIDANLINHLITAENPSDPDGENSNSSKTLNNGPIREISSSSKSKLDNENLDLNGEDHTNISESNKTNIPGRTKFRKSFRFGSLMKIFGLKRKKKLKISDAINHQQKDHRSSSSPLKLLRGKKSHSSLPFFRKKYRLDDSNRFQDDCDLLQIPAQHHEETPNSMKQPNVLKKFIRTFSFLYKRNPNVSNRRLKRTTSLQTPRKSNSMSEIKRANKKSRTKSDSDNVSAFSLSSRHSEPLSNRSRTLPGQHSIGSNKLNKLNDASLVPTLDKSTDVSQSTKLLDQSESIEKNDFSSNQTKRETKSTFCQIENIEQKQKQKHLVSIGVETPAVCGIQNHGNTCFINSIIQCLSNTTPLAEYYVMDYYLDDLARNNSIVHHKLSTCINGELTKCLSLLLKSLWSCMYSSDISLKFKRICSKYASQYLGHEQHDAQEFLLWVLDKSHEELRILDNVSNSSDDKMLFANGLESIKIPMEKSDERAAIEFLARCQKINSNSIIYDLFQSQLRSMIVCPNCGHSSKTFDPYMSLSLPVPIREKFTIFILVTFRENSTMVLYGLSIEAASTLRELKDEISRLVEIPQKRLLLLQFDNRLGMVEFSNNNETIQIQEILEDNESIHGLETPILSNAKNIDGSKEMCQQILTLVWLNRVGSVNSQNSIFGPFFTTIVSREVNYTELQTKILAEMSSYFIDGTDFECAKFSRAIPLRFEIVNTTDKNKKYIPNDVDHPLFVKQVESALIETEDSKNYNGPHHLKLIVEWDLDVRKSILVSDDKFDSIATKNRTFIDESVNLAKEHSKMDHYTLEDCLDMYFCDESLTLENAWMCPSCHSRQQSIKQLKIWSAPNILILHLKRSRYIPNLRHIKVNTLIKYPLNGLDLSKYIQKKNSVIPDIIDGEKISSPKSSIHRKNLKESSEENIYNLYAVCCHRGTIQEGHYTAMCKNSVDNCWYLYDDTKVMPLSEDLVVSSDACILFYQKSCIYDYHEKASTDEIDTVDGLRKIPINHWAFRMPPFSYYQTQAANANNNRSSTLPNRKSKNLGILTTSNMSNENSNLDHRERNHPMMQSSNPNYRALPHLNGPNSVKYNQNNYHQSRDANNRDEYNYYNNHQEYQNNPYYHDRQHDYHHSRANNVNHLQISQQMISTFPRNKSKYSY